MENILSFMKKPSRTEEGYMARERRSAIDGYRHHFFASCSILSGSRRYDDYLDLFEILG